MASPISCTSCGTTLITHCASVACHWWHCPGAGCEWITYDIQRGLRVSTMGNRVERLGAPPESEREG